MKVAATVVGTVLAASMTLTSVFASGGTSSYSKNGISFKYPSSWAKISDSESKQFGQELASFGGGVITYGAAGGVDKLWNKKNSGVVAILARMNVTKKFQKSLKGNEAKFISKFEGGIKKTKGIKVLSSGTGSFAGQSKASEMQVLNKSTGAREQFWIAIASDDKTIDLGIFVLKPASDWNTYSKALNSIAATSRFK